MMSTYKAMPEKSSRIYGNVCVLLAVLQPTAAAADEHGMFTVSTPMGDHKKWRCDDNAMVLRNKKRCKDDSLKSSAKSVLLLL